MPERSHFYILLLAIAASVSLVTAFLIWKRRRVPIALPMLVFMLALLVWSATYAVYWASPTSTRLFWLNATYWGVAIAPGAFFAFTLYQMGRQAWLKGRWWLLSVEPVVSMLLLWTDSWHGLFYAGKQTPDSSVIFDGGPVFFFHLVYSYGLLLISVILLTRSLLRAQGVFQRQAALALFAALLPWASNIISLIGLNPLVGLDLTPISFTLTGLILTFSLYRTALLDIAPVARSQVVDHMGEAVIVVDLQHRIVDINPAGAALLHRLHGTPANTLVGLPVESMLADWERWTRASGPVEFHPQAVAGAAER